MEIQPFLSERSGREHMGPERRVKGPPHIVCPEVILLTRQDILDFSIRERHRGMTAEWKAILISAGSCTR